MKQYWNKFVKWIEAAIDARAATIVTRSGKIAEARKLMMK
jgi:hypothetical protein